MARYKARSRVTIGDGSIVNITEDGDRQGGPRFIPGDEAELTAKQAAQYSQFFEAVETKQAPKATNKQKQTGRNK